MKSGRLKLLEPPGPHRASYVTPLPLHYTVVLVPGDPLRYYRVLVNH